MSDFDVNVNADGATFNAEAALEGKIELRRRVREYVQPARVFEGFVGLAEMWRGAWHDAEYYVGCDVRELSLDEPMARLCCDNLIALRVLDLTQFNVFDFDAFGSPWRQVATLLSRRLWKRGEIGALVLTDGSSTTIRYGMLPRAMAELIGRSEICAATMQEARDSQDAALRAYVRRANIEPLRLWDFRGNGSGRGAQEMHYSAMVFRGLN